MTIHTRIHNHGARINLKRAMEFLENVRLAPEQTTLNERVQSAFETLEAVEAALRPENSAQTVLDTQ